MLFGSIRSIIGEEQGVFVAEAESKYDERHR
jgi:hypothetical protein